MATKFNLLINFFVCLQRSSKITVIDCSLCVQRPPPCFSGVKIFFVSNCSVHAGVYFDLFKVVVYIDSSFKFEINFSKKTAFLSHNVNKWSLFFLSPSILLSFSLSFSLSLSLSLSLFVSLSL